MCRSRHIFQRGSFSSAAARNESWYGLHVAKPFWYYPLPDKKDAPKACNFFHFVVGLFCYECLKNQTAAEGCRKHKIMSVVFLIWLNACCPGLTGIPVSGQRLVIITSNEDNGFAQYIEWTGIRLFPGLLNRQSRFLSGLNYFIA